MKMGYPSVRTVSITLVLGCVACGTSTASAKELKVARLADAEVESDTELTLEAEPGAAADGGEAAPDHSGSTHGAGSHSGGAQSGGSHSAGSHSSGSHGGGSADPLESDVDLAIWTLAIFIVLMTVLRLLAWDPIVKALAAREDSINGDIAAAADKHEQAKALLAEHEAKIASATDDVRAMLEEARRDAEVTKSQIVEQARQAAEAEKQRAVREIDQARDSAVKQLAEESANLAIDLAGKVVKREISPERQGEIVSEAIGRLASSSPSSN